MRYLMWTYYAPLSAHSVVATGQDITTRSRPTRTGVIGVLASCLGIERTQVADLSTLHEGIGVAVRVDAAGAHMTDYHTAMVPRGEQARGQRSRWHELQAGRPEAQQLTVITSSADFTRWHTGRGLDQKRRWTGLGTRSWNPSSCPSRAVHVAHLHCPSTR